MEYWDPIGVQFDVDASDEYDGYTGELTAILRENGDLDRIKSCMNYYANDLMRCPVPLEVTQDVAKRLLDIKIKKS